MNQFDKYAKMFVPGALLVPKKLAKSNMLKAPAKFQGPKELILSGYCTPVENQGAKPWCAAYSASSYAENLRWRLDGYHRDIDPAPIYAYAKSIDGSPNTDGTYLECTLKALMAGGHLPDTCIVKTFSTLRDVKYAIHKYGVCIAGFRITSDWFAPKKGVILGGGDEQGGHAVTVCGYDEGGVLILNSWGADWGHDGFAYIPVKTFEEQFMYGAALSGVFQEMK